MWFLFNSKVLKIFNNLSTLYLIIKNTLQFISLFLANNLKHHSISIKLLYVYIFNTIYNITL